MADGLISVRGYRLGDDAILEALWRRTMPADVVDADTLAVKLLADPNFDREGCLIAERGGEPVGFLVAIARRVPLGPDGALEMSTGWITVFGVVPDARRSGVASALFDAGERFLSDRGRARVEVAPYAPNYFWPGVDRDRYPAALAFLAARGYRKLYDAVAMDRNLVGFTIPDEVRAVEVARESEGYRFGHLSPRYVRPLIEFNERVFYPDWTRAMRETILRRVPWDRTRIALNPDDELVGYAQYGAYDHVPDRFGPFGVDETLRGSGLGKVLLYRTLEDMVAKGFHNTWFLWTGETTPAGYLYHRAGFTTTRTFEIWGSGLPTA